MGSHFTVNPEDPRAPSQAVWDALGPDERAKVLASLPSTVVRTGPPEGDEHEIPKERSKLTLKEHFRRRGLCAYVRAEGNVYYPAESVFAPDVYVVADVPNHSRESWTVSYEGRGLDFVLEIHVKGDRAKDYVRNVERYARLGIPEYFLYDPPMRRLLGYRLPNGGDKYEPIVPQEGNGAQTCWA